MIEDGINTFSHTDYANAEIKLKTQLQDVMTQEGQKRSPEEVATLFQQFKIIREEAKKNSALQAVIQDFIHKAQKGQNSQDQEIAAFLCRDCFEMRALPLLKKSSGILNLMDANYTFGEYRTVFELGEYFLDPHLNQGKIEIKDPKDQLAVFFYLGRAHKKCGQFIKALEYFQKILMNRLNIGEEYRQLATKEIDDMPILGISEGTAEIIKGISS